MKIRANYYADDIISETPIVEFALTNSHAENLELELNDPNQCGYYEVVIPYKGSKRLD